MFSMVSCELPGTSPRASQQAPWSGIFFRRSSARPRIHPNCEGSWSSGAEALHKPPGASGGWTVGVEESHVFPQEREASSAIDVKSKDVVGEEESYVLPREPEGSSANDVKSMEYHSFDDALIRYFRAKSARQAKRARRARCAKEMRRMMDALMEGNLKESDCTYSCSVVTGCAYEYTHADWQLSEWLGKISL
eukprot:TRINITY_DN13716_c0_g2_i1.p1 TRINITY_DN13716_c0_g2~~TRINITY_DN13716_c0_g2_i1.p1  ORF type:complete len:193 (-),score=15.89 TRINITY_DN13716_c0_g2_i1:89-667(-)